MTEHIHLKPFIKWAGGKTQLLEILQENFPTKKGDKKNKIIRYIEPFIGGGALFFDIIKYNREYDFQEIIINDINFKLINVYRILRSNVEGLIKKLEFLKQEYLSLSSLEEKEKMFYRIRAEFNSNMKNRKNEAAYFIFLNKTCYNGLYRENSSGGFNVPFGQSKNPSFYDEKSLREISKLLNMKNKSGKKIVKIYNQSYIYLEKYIKKNTFVYMDPPYRPITKSGFTSYSKSGFNDNDQKQLAKFCEIINKKGGKFLLSNSDPKNYDPNDSFFDELYSDFEIKRIFASRNINSNGSGRGKISEILVKNY